MMLHHELDYQLGVKFLVKKIITGENEIRGLWEFYTYRNMLPCLKHLKTLLYHLIYLAVSCYIRR